jgi:hypothetical protein
MPTLRHVNEATAGLTVHRLAYPKSLGSSASRRVLGYRRQRSKDSSLMMCGRFALCP